MCGEPNYMTTSLQQEVVSLEHPPTLLWVELIYLPAISLIFCLYYHTSIPWLYRPEFSCSCKFSFGMQKRNFSMSTMKRGCISGCLFNGDISKYVIKLWFCFPVFILLQLGIASNLFIFNSLCPPKAVQEWCRGDVMHQLQVQFFFWAFCWVTHESWRFWIFIVVDHVIYC